MLIVLDDNNIEALSPYVIFANWFDEAKLTEVNDPEAMALACADLSGRISLRMVLLKAYADESDSGEDKKGDKREGFSFYTNLESDKGKALLENPHAALLFHWKSLRRQVRIEGMVELVDDKQADAYFQSRPRPSRLGAWASQQSRPLKNRFALQKQTALMAAKYPLGKVPRPPYWSGFRLIPSRLEFWQDGAYRLHDRFVFEKNESNQWQTTRLYP